MSKEKDPLLNSSSSEAQKESDAPPPWLGKAPGCVIWLYDHRERIPGYGVIKLLRKASLYSMYVLLILLLVYLVNQLDRYTISITAKYVGLDLHFGTIDCMPNMSLFKQEKLSRSYLVHTMMKDCNKNGSLKTQELCEDYEALLPNDNNNTTPICAWDHDGAKGIKYQILAGPVFNNLYPLAGILMGILADRFNRKILLGLSLLLWSLATGATGFAVSYVMLLIFRMLLALGAAGCNPFALSIIADYFPQELRGSAVGIYYWGIYFGYSLAYAIGNGVNIGLGWRWVFFISALMGIVLVPLVFFTVKEPKRSTGKDTKAVNGDKGTLNNTKEWSWDNFLYQLREIILKIRQVILTFIMPGMLTLCIAGSIRNAGGYVWAYNTQPFFSLTFDDAIIASYMSVIPLVGGSIGAVVGGLISDLLVKGRGPYARIWVLIISQIIAAPFAAGALFLPYPWCFLSLIPSNVFGEMWIGVLSAIVLDISPKKIRTTVIAVYLFIITVIGGNFNVLVAPIQKALKKHIHGDDDTQELRSMQWTLFLTFPCLYALSSLLFVLAFLLMRFDIKWKERKESESVSLNRPAKSGSVDSVEEQ